MKILATVIIGLVALLGLLFGILQIWFWSLRQKEIKETEQLVKNLQNKNTPKLTREEQFRFVDGNWDFTKIETILNEKKISLAVLNYFIDLKPDEYLDHLRKHNPPTYWTEDLYGEAEIKKDSDGYSIIYYDRGKEIATKYFEDYDQLLRYLVYKRLTNIGYKYEKLLTKSYYA